MNLTEIKSGSGSTVDEVAAIGELLVKRGWVLKHEHDGAFTAYYQGQPEYTLRELTQASAYLELHGYEWGKTRKGDDSGSTAFWSKPAETKGGFKSGAEARFWSFQGKPTAYINLYRYR